MSTADSPPGIETILQKLDWDTFSKVAQVARREHRAWYWKRHDRESYRCPDCGRLEAHPAVDQLEVHHKDGDPLNGEPSNLVALCQHCHYERHGKSQATDLEDWKASVYEMDGGA